MAKPHHGRRHTPHPWPQSPISGCCHRTVLPSMGEFHGKQFALIVGDSHLRSFVDGYVAMPPDKFSFGFMCTPGASANALRKEICHADQLPLDPEVVCLLAPGNNLVSSPTIDMASKDFECLLKAALYRWPKLFVLEFPIRFPDQHDGDIPLDYQFHLQQEYHRVAARMGVRYFSTTDHFPVWNSLLWCHDGVHLSDDHGMPVLAKLIWNASYHVNTAVKTQGHTFSHKEIREVLLGLAQNIPALKVFQHNDPLDLMYPLMLWLHDCGVRTGGSVTYIDKCAKCNTNILQSELSDQTSILQLPLPDETVPLLDGGVTLTALLHNVFSKGESKLKCNICGSNCVRQTVWNTSPDIVVLNVCRVGMDMAVMRTHVPPPDLIEVPLKDNKQKYKLKATICHSGEKATGGHYWARLIFDNVTVKANDLSISVDTTNNVDRAGVIHLYEIYNDMSTSQHKHTSSPASDVVDVTQCLTKEPMDIAVPLLCFLTETSAIKECYERLQRADQLQPSPKFKAALNQLNQINNVLVQQSQLNVNKQLDFKALSSKIERYVSDVLPANFLANDLLYLHRLCDYVCHECGDATQHDLRWLMIDPEVVSETGIATHLKVLADNIHRACNKCKNTHCLKPQRSQVIHTPQTLLVHSRNLSNLSPSFSLPCIYSINSYDISSIIAFSENAPLMSFFKGKNHLWYNSRWRTSAVTVGYTFDLTLQILSRANVYVVAYEKTGSAKALDYKQVETMHSCSDRCKEHQESNLSVPVPVKGFRSSPNHDNLDILGGWLNDSVIDEYHKLLQSNVKDMSVFICNATFVSQELRSLCCGIDVFPKTPKASHNWWKCDKVLIPVHLNSHWASIAIDLKGSKIKESTITVEAELMDSLKRYESQMKHVLLLLQRYLTLQYLALHGLVVDITVNYQYYHSCPNFLQQTDGSSCGIFACLHSKAFMFGVTMNKFKECDKAKCVAYELSELKLIL